MKNTIGTLFLVGTPIGNLDDMTFRGVKTLTDVDELYCEDTRRTSILLTHFKIHRKTAPKSFHDHSHASVIHKITDLLVNGMSVAYVTDGGVPVVSDPGFVLVREAIRAKVPVVMIPGPSAATYLFAVSGLPSPKYYFHGFFPQTKGEIEKVLETIRNNKAVHVFYESPARAIKTIELLAKHFPKNEMAFGREFTKMHEEVLRGNVADLSEQLNAMQKLRGECAFAILGNDSAPAKLEQTNQETGEVVIELTDTQKAEIAALISAGISSKDASKELSKKFGVPRRVIYEFIIRTLT